ncbi:MAG: hypothetical protein ABW122_06395 [Ilumatobacteraceae bacterium]
MTEPLWVVRRNGSAHEVLTTDGSWGRMVDAVWFDTQDEALAAPVPAGTTGSVVQAHPDTDPGA